MKTEYLLDHDLIAVGRETTVLVCLRATAPNPARESRRPPIRACLVLDRSLSMQGLPLRHTKRAARLLIDSLQPTDEIALVTYSSQVELLVPMSPVVDKALLLGTIDGIREAGNTNLSGGWLEGLGQVARHSQPDGIRRVLLLTDGNANEGITDPEKLVAIAREYRGLGVTTSTLGFGIDYDERLLSAIGLEGGGSYYYIESPSALRHAFAAELGTLTETVAQNLRITISPEAPATIVECRHDLPATRTSEGLRIRLGDLVAGKRKEVLLVLHVPALPSPRRVRLAQAVFEYDDVAGTYQHREESLEVMVEVAEGEDIGRRAPNSEVMLAEARLRIADTTRQASDLLRRRAAAGALIVLQAALEELRPLAEANEAFRADWRLFDDRVDRLQRQMFGTGDSGTLASQSKSFHHLSHSFTSQSGWLHDSSSKESNDPGRGAPGDETRT